MVQRPDGQLPPEPAADAATPVGRGGSRQRRRLIVVAAVAVVVLVGAGIGIGLAVAGGGSDQTGPQRPQAIAVSAGRPGRTATPATTTALNAADAALLASLRPFAVTDCRPGPREGVGVTAALRCAPGGTTDNAPATITISRYADAAALRADTGRRSAALSDVGDCRQGQTSVERWAHSSRRRGAFLCDATPGRFAVYWTVDDELLGLTTEDADAARLLAWWRDYDPI